MSVKLIRQYTVFIPNVPGALYKFVELFANEGVNIIGIASEIRDDSGVVRGIGQAAFSIRLGRGGTAPRAHDAWRKLPDWAGVNNHTLM